MEAIADDHFGNGGLKDFDNFKGQGTQNGLTLKLQTPSYSVSFISLNCDNLRAFVDNSGTFARIYFR